jgi:hypothetical protein
MDGRDLQRWPRRRAGTAAVLAVCLGLTAPAVAQARDVNLILDYAVKRACTVHPNYPHKGVRDNDGWPIAPGDAVGWRYNASRTWSMISDRKFNGNLAHPWWGFVRRGCIGRSIGGEHFPTATSSYPAGRPVPRRRRSGRSAPPGLWAHVDLSPPGATITGTLKACSNGTLRDAPNNFVIGNVLATWHVRVTNQTQGGWTKVFVPAALRWGWLETAHLRDANGNPC